MPIDTSRELDHSGGAHGVDDERHVDGLLGEVGDAGVEDRRIEHGEVVARHRETGHGDDVASRRPVRRQRRELARVPVESMGEQDQRRGHLSAGR